jgi:hypothetical protein
MAPGVSVAMARETLIGNVALSGVWAAGCGAPRVDGRVEIALGNGRAVRRCGAAGGGRLRGAAAATARCAFPFLVLCLLLVAPRPLAAASYLFTSPDGGYSVTFPAPPQEQVNEDDGARTVLNALNQDNAYYAVVHVDNKVDHDLDDELEDNVTRATKQFNAPTQLRKKRKFPRGSGDQLPAEEFTFESAELAGKGMVIVDGRRTYMVLALGIKPHEHKAAVDRFVKSFKFKVAPPASPKTAKVAKDRGKPKADPAAAAQEKE